ncbi:MAG: EamA family transporter [Clostridiales bacterium]|nr:EamA family transporter [Clostridiales bacterium]
MKRLPTACALLAALCYGISAPVAKLLLARLPPALLAALLYLGAGIGMSIVNLFRKKREASLEAKLTKAELPYAAAMILLDIAAPILLMFGLSMSSPASASLLNNFEIVATALIALVAFKEAIGRRMWLAIGAITLGSAMLSISDFETLTFSMGSIFVLLACVSWGIENNCTSKLSLKDPLQIVVIKGFGSGVGALAIALATGSSLSSASLVLAALALGFVAYGLSIYFYILAQRGLGAARTSAFYAFAPFVGAGLSFAVFRETPTISFAIALVVMLAGACLAAFERHSHSHAHEEMEHEHRHSHSDGHHNHTHEPPVTGEHSHAHVHAAIVHTHAHAPDMHHAHKH